MKKKVLLSSIATIMLCFCLIAGSTFALFTSQTEVNIAVTAGQVEMTAGIAIDKLESVPGTRTELSPEEFARVVNTVGAAVVGQTGTLCPADKKLYALRDFTATVENNALIASSIMSKKLASGADVIMLDVKYGSGALSIRPAANRHQKERSKGKCQAISCLRWCWHHTSSGSSPCAHLPRYQTRS